MSARYYCRDEERRAAVRDSPLDLNGIDYLEVGPPDQKTLFVYFVKPPPPPGIAPDNIALEGGVRTTNIKAVETSVSGNALKVKVDAAGDFSVYTLRLKDVPNLDPRLSSVPFSFKVGCPSDFDCKPETNCPPRELSEPEINYLAKDYAGFRRLILDRLAAIVPDWRLRNPADLGMVMVEMLAYVGDHLSYYQDAVATEAYLGTARKRISVRRHARLVDYTMHEGCNARAWVLFEVEGGGPADGLKIPGPDADRPGVPVLIRPGANGVVMAPEKLKPAVDAGTMVFETMHDVTLREAHNRIEFHTWSNRECCLPAGATEATLVKPAADLEEGRFLVFEEVLGPKTGDAADADPQHRHVVRLTSVVAGADPVENKDVVEISWSQDDALPFPLCISGITDNEHGAKFIDNVSVARGNLVLADHGLTLRDSDGPDPLKPLGEDIGEASGERPFRPALGNAPLTYAVPLPGDDGEGPAAAAEFTNYRPHEALPAVRLKPKDEDEEWTRRQDLLSSDRFAADFVVEMEENGLAHLRFGDDEHGKVPAAGTGFTAGYRVGNGAYGNVGAGAMGTVVLSGGAGIAAVRNPLPAAGGREPESLEEVRQFAPQAFRKQQRAVTETDYARVAERHRDVQRAVATFRWTGSWHTVFLTVDRLDGGTVDAEFERRLREHMSFFRMAGYDLEIDGPVFVPLELVLGVCVKSDHFRSNVKAALLDRLGNQRLPGGKRGFFHPDNWTFNQPVYLSEIHAAAREVEGVDSIDVEIFKRWGRTAEDELDNAILTLGRTEIARLDNDPNFRENGLLKLKMRGGK